MDKDILMDFFKRDFEEIKCNKEFYNNLSDEEKDGILFDILYNIIEDIEEEYTEELKDENQDWYKEYQTEMIDYIKKYMEKN